MSRLCPHVLAARERLAEGHERLRKRHEAGCPGVALCAAIADLRDEVILGLYEAALADLEPAAGLSRQICLVAHGGYGRRDLAPYSDVDLMILHAGNQLQTVGRLAKRLWCDLFDAGLALGHSVRTIQEACTLACHDPAILSSLIESRYLIGSAGLFCRFWRTFRRRVRQRAAGLIAALQHARLEERLRFGETVYLLEPNLKRSRGGLRDLQLLRWIGMARYGTPEPDALRRLGVLAAEDHRALSDAAEFLLRLRNELHFHAGKSADVLTRPQQVRIAALWGYQPGPGTLPVEQFMRDYFRHTDRLSHLVSRFAEQACADKRRRLAPKLSGRPVGGYLVGQGEIRAGRAALKRLRASPVEILELVALAAEYDKPLAPETWEAVRRQAARLPPNQPLAPEGAPHFLRLLEYPRRLGELLRGLHEIGLLERLIPALGPARGLLQFNQYHKFTVDEHCLRAVEWATELLADPGPLGRVYRALPQKKVLHLALLIHDLGKAYPGDHREVGLRIAGEAAGSLGLDAPQTEALKFLVHQHLLMNHLAFRRDTGDPQLVLRFAVEVGSPELLQMLYVLTAADMAAIGPDTWTSWKAEVVTDLYHRAMQQLAGESPASSREEYLQARREAARVCLGPEGRHPWFARQIQSLPETYLTVNEPGQIAADLRLLAGLSPDQVNVQALYLPDTQTVQFTIGTREQVVPGIFHRLAGALSSRGLEILSAQIHTLADGLVLDRFWVRDPDYAGQPPAERLEEVRRALVESLLSPGKPLTFRRTWTPGGERPGLSTAQTRVLIDNTTSAAFTILDIFTLDRRGLLYAIARTIFELGLSVWRAKIGTYLDQVVDVFYVTDQEGRKVEDPGRLDQLRRRLLEVIEKKAG
ncbi:MAG: [protein-PII] uridylyltransferase [Thermoguttaceae bacterium]